MLVEHVSDDKGEIEGDIERQEVREAWRRRARDIAVDVGLEGREILKERGKGEGGSHDSILYLPSLSCIQ